MYNNRFKTCIVENVALYRKNISPKSARKLYSLKARNPGMYGADI